MSVLNKTVFKQGITWVLIFTLVSTVMDVLLNLDKLSTPDFFVSNSFLFSILKSIIIASVLAPLLLWGSNNRKTTKTKL